MPDSRRELFSRFAEPTVVIRESVDGEREGDAVDFVLVDQGRASDDVARVGADGRGAFECNKPLF